MQALGVYNWLCLYEDLQHVVRREQIFSLLKYSAYPLLAVHAAYSSNGWLYEYVSHCADVTCRGASYCLAKSTARGDDTDHTQLADCALDV